MTDNKNLNFWRNLPPALSNAETCALIREGSEESLEKVVIGNLRLIRAIVSRRVHNLQAGDIAVASEEDLEQECVFILMKCAKSFDPDRGVAFSTFASRSITNVLGMEYRRQGRKPKTVSLETRIHAVKGDDEGLPIADTIADPKFEDDNFESFLDVYHLKTKILPLLPKREREIFIQQYFYGKTREEIALLYRTVRTNITRYLMRARAKVQAMAENGITADDIALRKVALGKLSLQEFKRKRAILKKFGEDFLRSRFLLKLTSVQATLFKSAYLNFYGQPNIYISLETGIKSKDILRESAIIEKILQDTEEELLREKAEFDKLPIIKKTSNEVKRAKMLVEKCGGKAFLWKYFVPILKDSEKKVFIARVLNFDGSLSNKEIADSLGISLSELKETTYRLVGKMSKTDFGLLNDLIDNSNSSRNFDFDMDFDRIKERVEFVQKHGKKLEIIKQFEPSLNKLEKQIFRDFYLFPIYIKEENYAKAKGLTQEEFDSTENQVRDKLEHFTFVAEENKPTNSDKIQTEAPKTMTKSKNK